MTEINCPPDCVYLASAREHPAAVVRRQQERDLGVLLPTIQNLTERQYQLFMLFQTLVSRHKPEGFARLVDDDLADAAGATAATLETAARGVIYEHPTQSRLAQRLAGDMKQLLADLRKEGATVSDREAALVLRSIEAGAREARKTAAGGDVAYLTLMSRLLQTSPGAAPREAAETEQPRSSLIVP